MEVSFILKHDELYNNLYIKDGLLFWIDLDDYGPFTQLVCFSQNFSSQAEWTKKGADASCVLVNKKVPYSDLKFFFQEKINTLVLGGENDVYEKTNALFLHYEPFLGIHKNKKQLKFSLEIDSVYEGSYLDWEHHTSLKKVDTNVYKPGFGENFELLIKFKFLLKEGNNVPEYFYYTITTPKKVEIRYKKYFEETLQPIVFSYKMYCQELYNFENAILYLNEFFSQVEGASKNEIMLKLSSLLDYPQKDVLLKKEIMNGGKDVKSLKVSFY
jgi:hypothetical protein